MPHKPASDVLSHITVLDLTRVRAGPTCVRQLADWGANVIKIEDPDADGVNGMGGPRGGPDFQNLHRNKRGMTLNLKDPKGVEIFMRLAAKADVVVENYRPDVKRRLGIDYDAVRKVNPRIIYGSISGFGHYQTRYFLNGSPCFSTYRFIDSTEGLFSSRHLAQRRSLSCS